MALDGVHGKLWLDYFFYGGYLEVRIGVEHNDYNVLIVVYRISPQRFSLITYLITYVVLSEACLKICMGNWLRQTSDNVRSERTITLLFLFSTCFVIVICRITALVLTFFKYCKKCKFLYKSFSSADSTEYVGHNQCICPSGRFYFLFFIFPSFLFSLFLPYCFGFT